VRLVCLGVLSNLSILCVVYDKILGFVDYFTDFVFITPLLLALFEIDLRIVDFLLAKRLLLSVRLGSSVRNQLLLLFLLNLFSDFFLLLRRVGNLLLKKHFRLSIFGGFKVLTLKVVFF